MDFSYIFRSAKLISEHLENAGFEKDDNGAIGQGRESFSYTLRREICDGDFFALISLNPTEETLIAQVYDSATNEKYSLFDNNRAHGAFVGAMRKEVQKIIEEIRANCFYSADVKEKYIAFLNERFGAEPDFPWADTPDYCVFRAENQKWFALIMKIKYKQLGPSGQAKNCTCNFLNASQSITGCQQPFLSDEEVWVVNMKADSDKIASLIDKKSIFPAWHMNKKHWITVLLTAATDFDRLCVLTERSFKLVQH